MGLAVSYFPPPDGRGSQQSAAIVTPPCANCYLPGSSPRRFSARKAGALEQRIHQLHQLRPGGAPAGRYPAKVQISNGAGRGNGRQINLVAAQLSIPPRRLPACRDREPLSPADGAVLALTVARPGEPFHAPAPGRPPSRHPPAPLAGAS